MIFGQATADPTTVVELVTQGGLVGALAAAIVGFLREWVVPGPTYRRALAERDEWRRLAHQGSTLAKEAVEVAAHVDS